MLTPSQQIPPTIIFRFICSRDIYAIDSVIEAKKVKSRRRKNCFFLGVCVQKAKTNINFLSGRANYYLLNAYL